MGREKKHHFVPSSYLARFTRGGTDESDLWVFDLEHHKNWKSTPRGSAHQKDYNLLEVEGLDPLLAEKDVFGTIEGEAVSAFDEIIAGGERALASGDVGFATNEETLEKVLVFIAAQAIRVPTIRASLDEFHSGAMKLLGHALARNEKAFENAKAEQPEMSDISFAEFREFMKEAEFQSKGTPTRHLGMTLPTLFPLAEVLRRRAWTLVFGPLDGPMFFTSDDPVTLVAKEEHPIYGVGFATPGSTVLFPVSRRALLFGSPPEMALPPAQIGVLEGEAMEVAAMNNQVVLHAPAKLYVGDSDGVCALDERAVSLTEFLTRLKHDGCTSER